MRDVTIHRALNPTSRLERLVHLNPSLSMRTVHWRVAAGRQTMLQHWQGARAALDRVKRDYVASPPASAEAVELARESREGLLVLAIERPGAAPDVGALVERHLGPDAVASLEVAREGVTWRILTRAERNAPAFLRALREAEDAYEKKEGAAIPRFAAAPGPAAQGWSPKLLTPLERAVLAQARKDGFYAQPRKAGIAEVGRSLKMPASTALYHLRAAQRKLVDDYLRR